MSDAPRKHRTKSTHWSPGGVRRLAGSLSVTLVGQGFLLCGLFLITRISATVFDAVGFGQYQVARRTLAVVASPLLCGIGVSMPRYIARGIGDRREVASWLLAGGSLAATFVAVFLVLGALWSAEIGRWTFGEAGGRRLVLALLLAVAGTFCCTLAYSAMRGLSRFRSAAALQVLGGALAPLAGILIAGGQVDRALAIVGGLGILIGGTVFFRVCRKWAHPAPSAAEIRGAVRALFIFGVPRIPGDAAIFGLFALPAYAAVHRNDIVSAGFLSVGLSLLQAIATVFAATGFVLLPYWSRAAMSADTGHRARKRIGMLLIASGLVTGLVLALIQVFLQPLVRLLLGPLAGAGLNDIRFVSLGAVPYVIYMVLRDYFDAMSVFPMNTVALTAAIVIQAVLLSRPWLSLPTATAGGFFALGLFMLASWAASLRLSRASQGTESIEISEVSRESVVG
jgi:O-antigen/teichoic acid export membrane protein